MLYKETFRYPTDSSFTSTTRQMFSQEPKEKLFSFGLLLSNNLPSVSSPNKRTIACYGRIIFRYTPLEIIKLHKHRRWMTVIASKNMFFFWCSLPRLNRCFFNKSQHNVHTSFYDVICFDEMSQFGQVRCRSPWNIVPETIRS